LAWVTEADPSGQAVCGDGGAELASPTRSATERPDDVALGMEWAEVVSSKFVGSFSFMMSLLYQLQLRRECRPFM
jgi:hypothetical protein